MRPRLRQKNEQGDQRKGYAEGEHYLAYYQRATRIQAHGEDYQGRRHRDQTPQPQRYLPVYEALHNNLPGHGADRGAGEAAGQQGHAEYYRRVVADQHTKLLEGEIYVPDVGQTVGVGKGGGHDEHAGVDGTGDNHGYEHVHELEAEDFFFSSSVLPATLRWVSAECR
jgi:hypothetical protein